MTYEVFDANLNSLLEINKREDDFVDKLYPLFGSGAIELLDSITAISAATAIVERSMGDTEKILDYFIFECSCDYDLFSERTNTFVTNSKDLYDYILKENKIKV